MKANPSADFSFVTSNDIKFQAAKFVLDTHGIIFDRQLIDFVEIQADDGESIARHKAEQAFAALQAPVVVTDDSWLIPGLNGFPGAYMHQVNDWFSADDWLRLTRDLVDRRMILRQIIVYQDVAGQQLFSSDIEALILHESRTSSGLKHFSIISFDGGRSSAAEVFEAGESAIKDLPNSWQAFSEWFIRRNT